MKVEEKPEKDLSPEGVVIDQVNNLTSATSPPAQRVGATIIATKEASLTDYLDCDLILEYY